MIGHCPKSPWERTQRKVVFDRKKQQTPVFGKCVWIGYSKVHRLIRHFKWEDVTFSFIWAPRGGCCPEATQLPCADRHGSLPFWVMQSYYLELQLLHTHSLNFLLFLGLIFLSSNIQLSMGKSSTETICWWGFQMWRQEGRTPWKLFNYENILTTHTAWPMFKTAPGRNYAYLY